MSNHLEKDRIRFICYTYIQTPNGSEIQIKAKKKKSHKLWILEENTNDFLSNYNKKFRCMKKRLFKFDYIKTKRLCKAKTLQANSKKQMTNWDKTFAAYIIDKSILSLVYK